MTTLTNAAEQWTKETSEPARQTARRAPELFSPPYGHPAVSDNLITDVYSGLGINTILTR